MKSKMDRRSFLKRSAAAAVLVPTAALLTGCEFELKDFLDHLLGQGGGTGLDTKAHLGSCTVQLMEVTLTDREAAARFRVQGLPAELRPAAACSAKADHTRLMLLSASKQSLAPSTAAQEVTVRFSLTDGQAEKLRQKGTLHFTLTAFGYRVEYLVDCPALAILPPSVSGPSQ